MHRILYYIGIFTGVIMLFASICIWFRFGIKKAFTDVISYGSNTKWSVDKALENKTVPLKNTRSVMLKVTGTVQKSLKVSNIEKESEETVLLKGYTSIEKDKSKSNFEFNIIEEIKL